MSSNELQALLSNLTPRSQARSPAASHSQQFSRPSSSAFLHTAPMPSTPPPPFSAFADRQGRDTTENVNQNRATSGATAQNLLNLLNFGGQQNAAKTFNQSQAGHSPALPPIAAPQPSTHAPFSASDLVARFMSPQVSTPKLEQKDDNTHTSGSEIAASQNPLLELLNKQSTSALGQGSADVDKQKGELDVSDIPVQSVEAPEVVHEHIESEERRDSPVRVFGTAASREPTPFEVPKAASPMPKENSSIFTYTNPFEALNASRNDTPAIRSPRPAQSVSPIPADEPDVGRFSSPAIISARKKLTPRLRSQRSTSAAPREESPVPQNAVQDAVSGLSTTSNQPPRSNFEPPANAAPNNIEHTQVVESTRDNQDNNYVAEGNFVEKQDDSGDWEDADDLNERDGTPRQVPVYNFPIKAFISITLNIAKSSDIGIREDGVMEISRLKKDFDQLDRSLAAATSKYITYAFVKNGGMRIIRQDDGSDRHVFKNSHDRIFNVAFCTTALNAPPTDNQAVLGTGISGAVYYASVSKEGNDLFEKNQLESESLIFPPFPQADENTAGGVLKTRAKRSSRHPEFFAIGRGKSIQLIWPATALSPRYSINETNRIVDVEKFYTDRPLQIATGKAGKDFTFSEDDTLIVSLDKTGRLRFWDIRGLVDEANATAARVDPVVVDTPILSLSTASPAEKSWPTSVTFVDKSRPYKKGGALRYVLVGLRQNHTLQLWDIALGKAVQELNFPHENETDGICSVNYHAESGIIVVSHPTRNSIFFIHLSAPRYSLSPQLSQATYVQRVAAKDPELPKPESTACMSGIREISFAEKGQLRSVELLPMQKSAETAKDETASLFELYVVHSRGVTCLGITKEDLGWNADSKVLYPVDAQEAGLLTMKDLKLGSVIEEPTRSKSPPREAPQPVKATKKKAKKSGQLSEDIVNGGEEIQQPANSVLENVVSEAVQPDLIAQDVIAPKEIKKSKKKAEKVVLPAEPVAVKPEVEPLPSPIKELPTQTQPSNNIESVTVKDVSMSGLTPMTFGPSEEWLGKEFKKVEGSISAEFKTQLDMLYQNVQSDRAAQDSSSASRQEAILRLVSTSLSTNVEKSLSRILAQQMQQVVVPAVVQQTSTQIIEPLTSTLRQTLPQEISMHLPNAVGTALQSPQMSRTIADSVTQKLSKHLETQVTDMVVKTITPLCQNIAIAAAEKATSDTEARLSAQMRQMQLDRAADNDKIDKLSSVLQGMAGTLQAMSDSQVAFQGQILKDRQAVGTISNSGVINTSRQVSTARGTPDPTPAIRPKTMRIRSKADIELEDITALMNEGRYEEGSIKWLQSAQPVKLFDELFVRFTPEYLSTDVSPLVAFSIAVTVANSLITNTDRRLEWISAAFDAVDLDDPEVADLSQHAPALITSLVQKLESLYMTVAERDPADLLLKTIPLLAKKGRDIKSAFVARAAGPMRTTLPQLTSGHY